ncbi:MAG: polysaccharide deacetylase [Peptococcaceae bacterium BICA1-7]|nr:MAG: polysaccharide deacetylase [Peptococcaceae bacterium BICA1-7]HBV98468.1 polysaccharide deacetylase [Desulfotomaculum sp.]
MTKFLKSSLAILISASIFLSGCSGSPQDSKADQNQNQDKNVTAVEPSVTQPNIDLSKVTPNENGKIMVVMFHNFVSSFTPSKYDDGQYTTTFNDFRKLLQALYDKGYRLISLNDLLNNNILVPAGCIPMVFTFDDGTPGQFNLVPDGEKLVANKESAVGIMEEFNKTHPDFGLEGTFFVNLGLKVFDGDGTVPERLKYLIDEGFEIGNHTMTHIHLNEARSAGEIQKEIGGEQKRMYELIPDYKIFAFSLPFGQPSKDLQEFVIKGNYQGVQYQNSAIMEVGWDPTVSPVSKKFNPLSIHRVRATGIKPVQADLDWWLQNLSRNEQYISDGNPDTVTIPKGKEADIDNNRLNGKKLVVY